MKVFVVSAMLFAVALAAPGILDNQVHTQEPKSFVSTVFGNCAESEDVTTCMAIRGITALNRAARSQNLEILPGVAFVRDPNSPVRAGKSLSENEIVASLPADATQKSGRLLDLALDSAQAFIGSHSLNVKFPEDTAQEVARAIEEGPRKIKKIAAPFILAIGAKIFALAPLLFGGILLLVTKALIVAKIAFVLAALLGLQKLGGSGGSGYNLLSKFSGAGGNSGWSSAPVQQGWSSGSTGGAGGWSSGASYPYARSYDVEEAQQMAYNAQAPTEQL